MFPTNIKFKPNCSLLADT